MKERNIECPSDANKPFKRVFVTQIHAKGVLSSLRRFPRGFHVPVEIDGKSTQISSKPASSRDDKIERDEEILLPLNPSSVVSFNLYASFGLGPRLGRGELLGRLKLIMGEVLDITKWLQPASFLVRGKSEGSTSSCWSLEILTKRRTCGMIKRLTTHGTESDTTNGLAQLADTGHHFLLCHVKNQNQNDLDEAIACFEYAHDICPPYHTDRSIMPCNLSNARLVDCQANICADLDLPIILFRNALLLSETSHLDHSETALALSSTLMNRYQRQHDERDMAEAMSLLSWTTEQFLDIDTGDPDDEELIQKARSILVNLPDSDPNRSMLLERFARLLRYRFAVFGNPADIRDSVLMSEMALKITPDGRPEKPVRLQLLGCSLGDCFGRFGDIADINKSISMHEEALRLTPDGHPNKATGLSEAGYSLSRRFDYLGDIADVNKSISMLEEATRLTPNNHPNKSARLWALAHSLSLRFDQLGDIADINESISMHEEAVRLTPDDHPNKPFGLCDLAQSLSRRFNRHGDIADIDNSISIHEEAICLTPSGHPSKSARLASLARSLSDRFDCLGDIADIDRSILMLEEAVRLTLDDHPNKPIELSELGNSLFGRFRRCGDIMDIDRSISMHEEAIRLTLNDHPDKPARLSKLANSLSGRFDLLSDVADISKSISMFEEAVRLTLDDHPNKPTVLSQLGNSLFRRFHRCGDVVDIDRSISMHEEAICLTPSGHPSKPARLSSLASSLSDRFDQLGDVADINKSIAMHEAAVHLTPNDHPNKPIELSNLGHSLTRRFHRLSDIVDIDKSILMHKEAIRLTPNGHFNESRRFTELGNVFMSYFQHVHDQSSLAAATDALSAAAKCPTSPISDRFDAARRWMSCVRLAGKPRSLLEPCSTIITLLPQLAWLGLPLTERHRVLLSAADIARDAAAAAIDTGQPETAVEWLEQGRSIVWNQLLNLRAPVDELHVDHPILADQFQQTSFELESISSRRTTNIEYLPSDLDSGISSFERETQRHHELVVKRDKLLEEIRSLPGFERFLLPKTIEQLSSFAHSGPVVYLNASEQRCDALIVKGELHGVILVPLPDVIYRDLGFLLRLLLKGTRNPIISLDDISALVSSDGEPPSNRLLSMVMRRGPSDRPGEPIEIEEIGSDDWFRRILEYLWMSVVNPVLKALGILTLPSGAEMMSRIFWCPTGPFSFLPIHAAGLYDIVDPEPGTKLSDFVISSYIPTLSSIEPLAETRKDSNNLSSPNTRLVAVPQPPNDGQMKLYCVKEEIDHIKQLQDNSPFIILQRSDGTIDDVMEKMKTSDWVHFACHGVQDRQHPLDSGLCLADKRRLKLSDIIRMSRPQGGLAFLSACQTARGDEKLPEESVHLAAGMLLAGYSGIIATMWSIKDRDAPQVTKDVYKYLFRDGKVPDPSEAAEALHHAIQRLRDSGASFSSWVPFIHVGK